MICSFLGALVFVYSGKRMMLPWKFFDTLIGLVSCYIRRNDVLYAFCLLMFSCLGMENWTTLGEERCAYVFFFSFLKFESEFVICLYVFFWGVACIFFPLPFPLGSHVYARNVSSFRRWWQSIRAGYVGGYAWRLCDSLWFAIYSGSGLAFCFMTDTTR